MLKGTCSAVSNSLSVDFPSISGKMQIMKCVAVLLGIALTASTWAAAQECKETARSQIEAVLDKSTNRVRLWNVDTAMELRSVQVRPAKPPTAFADVGERQAQLWRMAWRVAFSPDGKLLATGSSSAVQLWNPTIGQEVASSQSNCQVGNLHFTVNGQWVVWGNDRDEIV
jgi:WD40 repeat protein